MVKAEQPINMEELRAEIAPFVEIMERPSKAVGATPYLHQLVQDDQYAFNILLLKRTLDKSREKIKYCHEIYKNRTFDPEEVKTLVCGEFPITSTYGLNINDYLTEPLVGPEDEPMGQPREWKPLEAA